MNELYAACHDAFAEAGLEASVPETHGAMCGVLCAPGGADVGWLDELLGRGAASAAAMGECRRLLARAAAASARALDGGMFEFAPLLPGDDEPLDDRSRALGQWCGGFLYGLAIGGLPELGALPPELRELLCDLGQFGELATAADVHAAAADAESDYAELVEYVRVAVMTMYEEARGATGTPAGRRAPPS